MLALSPTGRLLYSRCIYPAVVYMAGLCTSDSCALGRSLDLETKPNHDDEGRGNSTSSVTMSYHHHVLYSTDRGTDSPCSMNYAKSLVTTAILSHLPTETFLQRCILCCDARTLDDVEQGI